MKDLELTLNLFYSFRRIDKIKALKYKDNSYNHNQRTILMLINNMKKDNVSLKPSDISSILRVSNATITPTLNQLEDDGKIIRKHSKKDRREVFLELTEKGLEDCKKTQQQICEKMQFIIDEVGEKEIEDFIKTLNKITDIIEDFHKQNNGKVD